MKKFLNKIIGALIKNKKLNDGIFLAACISIGLDFIAIEWTMFASGARTGINATVDAYESGLLKLAKENKNHE